jgi:CrcB protein
MLKLVLLAGGGAVGALLRYGVSGAVQRLGPAGFPSGTLVVNLLGCFVLGLLAAALSGPILLREDLRVGLLVGLLGAFTTFSTFGYETVQLAGAGRLGPAVANVLLSNVLGLTAVWMGLRLARRIWGI